MGTSLLAVVAPSVSGKTSVARRAAVRLAGGVLPGERGLDQAVIRPAPGRGARPAATMKERGFPPGTETVLCLAQPVIPLFTPDGAYLLAVTPTGVAYRWDLRPDSRARRACAVAARTLTRAECSAALPGREYAPA